MSSRITRATTRTANANAIDAVPNQVTHIDPNPSKVNHAEPNPNKPCRGDLGKDLYNAICMFDAIKFLSGGSILGPYATIDSIDSSKLVDILENESYILHGSDSEYVRMIGQYNDQSSLYLYKGGYYIIIVRQYDNGTGEYATINLNKLF